MKKVKKKLGKLIEKARIEKSFRLSKAYPIASYFRDSIRRQGFRMSEKNWDKTKLAATEIADKFSEISESEWNRAIDWCFVGRYKDNFLGKVPVHHLGTVVNTMYNHYKQSVINIELSQVGTQSGRIVGYGSK